MDKNLKEKTISALLFSSLGFLTTTVTQVILGVVMARLLLPSDYGLLGMIMIFIAVSQIFIDGGLCNALIREKEVTNRDYSTVFYYNLFLSILIYILIFIFSKFIGNFFNEPILVNVIRVLGLELIIGSFGIVQRTILVRKLDFKTQTIVSIISTIFSGIIAIWLAYLGFGIWALVVQRLSITLISSIMFIFNNKWIPMILFDFESFKKLFSFGGKILLTNLLITIYRNVNNVIIGKIYSVVQLGYYTNSLQLSEQVSLSVMTPVQKVTYPVLSQVSTDIEKFENGFKKIVKNVSFITIPIMMGLIAIANPLIEVIYGNKWLPMASYFQILCFAGITTAYNLMNYNVFLAKGRSDLALTNDLINMGIGLFFIMMVVHFKFGVLGLLYIRIATGIIAFFITTYFSSKLVSYNAKEQLVDSIPNFVASLFMAIFVYSFGLFLPFRLIIVLMLQIIAGAIIYILISRIFKIEELHTINEIIKRVMINKLTK